MDLLFLEQVRQAIPVAFSLLLDIRVFRSARIHRKLVDTDN